MSIDAKQLRDLIVIPALKEIDKYSDSAVNLILGTIAQESQMGRYLKQLGSGPALGICQIESATHTDIYENYLRYLDDDNQLKQFYHMPVPAKTMVHDLFYAVQMCRIHYLRVSEPLPSAHDVLGMAEYWKRFFNTEKGAGTVGEFIENYNHYVAKVAL